MDERPARQVPMEVVCLGLCRTGTQTLSDALECLGYGKIYHMREVLQGKQGLPFWKTATLAHLANDKSKLPTAADLDRETSEFRGCSDVPISIFIEELLDAYPDAKLILTTRPPEAWMKSMNSTILHMLADPNSFAPPVLRDYGQALTKLWDDDFEKNGRDFFLRHNERAREEVAKRGRKLLEIDVSQPENWKRLCEWLGKEPPAGLDTFPNSDGFRKYKIENGFQVEGPVSEEPWKHLKGAEA